LLFISDIIKNIGIKKVFTIPKSLVEPTVMFFSLTNSLATFQAMRNELIRDLINMGKIGSFINNMMIGTESKEEHDKLVEEILRRLEENDLYVKPEKCR